MRCVRPTLQTKLRRAHLVGQDTVGAILVHVGEEGETALLVVLEYGLALCDASRLLYRFIRCYRSFRRRAVRRDVRFVAIERKQGQKESFVMFEKCLQLIGTLLLFVLGCESWLLSRSVVCIVKRSSKFQRRDGRTSGQQRSIVVERRSRSVDHGSKGAHRDDLGGGRRKAASVEKSRGPKRRMRQCNDYDQQAAESISIHFLARQVRLRLAVVDFCDSDLTMAL